MRLRPCSLMVGILAATTAHADMQSGAELFKNNCVACHVKMVGGDGSAIYTRPDHRVRSLAALEKQVQRCKEELGLTWFDDEIADVAAYVNATYYHFKP